MRRTFAPLVVSTAAIGLLAACAASVQAPIAEIAGPAAPVNAGSFVQLDGSGSKDPQNRSLTFTWTFDARPLGSTTTLADANTAKPSFMADVPGNYVVNLTVSNSVLTSTTAATVTVQVSTCAANAPVINGIQTSRATMNIGDSVQFTADVTDADNAPPCNLSQTFNYAWLLTQQPEGSRASLNNERSEKPSFTADKAGDYVVRLVVTDSTGLSSAQKTLTQTVKQCGAAAPTVTATAMPQTTHPNAAVNLTATVTDPDNACGANQTSTVQWSVRSKPDASSPVFSDSRSLRPTFAADKAGAYDITVTVDACGNVPPTVDSISASSGVSGTPPAGRVGTSITVDPVNVSNLNCLATGAPTSEWSLSVPSGSRAALSDPAATSPSFTPDVPGDYQVSLQVRDSLGIRSSPVFLRISALDCTPAPIAPVVNRIELVLPSADVTPEAPPALTIAPPLSTDQR